MKFVPKILNNIAQDCGSKITRSVPLGHLSNTKQNIHRNGSLSRLWLLNIYLKNRTKESKK